MKKSTLDYFFKKKNLYASLAICMFSGTAFVFFLIKRFRMHEQSANMCDDENAFGMLIAFGLFTLFFPLVNLLFFTNSLGKDFFVNRSPEDKPK